MAKNEGKNLRKIFERYEKILFKAANNAQSETPYSYKTEFFKRVDRAAQTFKQNAQRYVDKDIPDMDLSPHAEEVLRKAGAFHETANVKLTTYVQMVSKLTASADEFKGRIQAQIDEDEKKGVITTITNLKEYINEELRSGRGIAILYSNGAQMPTDKYAEMLSRTTRMETQNLSMLGKALDDGNDLVECSTISHTCPTCAMYQGRIYSISGKTPGYPALYETAFKNGYSVIHPNCRHQFFPYNPKFHTAEERAELEKNTQRPFEESDPQSERAREEYARSQMQMRQWNKELNEFAEMQKRYGKDAPYQTLGSFRRAYRSEKGSLAYGRSHFMHRDERQYENFQEALGKENVPETLAKFQEMKYNKDQRVRREIALMSKELKLKRDSVGHERLRNYSKASIPQEKTRDYVLNPESKDGKSKAHVVKSVLGYEQADYKEFTELIRSNLPHYRALESGENAYGRKYAVPMILHGKTGRRLEVTTVWQFDTGSDFPRFITLTFKEG